MNELIRLLEAAGFQPAGSLDLDVIVMAKPDTCVTFHTKSGQWQVTNPISVRGGEGAKSLLDVLFAGVS